MKHHFLDDESTIESPIRSLNPKTKFITIIAVVLFVVSTPADAFYVFLLFLVLALILIMISRVPITVFLKRVLIAVPFVLVALVAVPFVPEGPGATSYSLGIGAAAVTRTGFLLVSNVLCKSILSILFLTLLISSTPFRDLLSGLRELRVPSFITDTLSFMYQYLFIITDEIQRVAFARDARLYGNRWIWQAPVVGHMIGSIFVRSFERGERIFLAMKARGYDSEIVRHSTGPLRISDYLFGLIIISGACAIRLFGIGL
ncbi:MAG: cobalt ECF transporter T component CbiQ [Deltaproteobacteria bacterium]|nr:cobalt ECF transporter T component CbiQ [Candidatus Zymogenaceae bacterium]